MKFSEKLQKIRKQNNLSQEALAEKLNMSRQAISKWESGSSYPDMATMINICKILNCTLEDLLDDDALGINNFSKDNKFNINKYIKEMLDFITKSYNMFWSMKFVEKIKCLLEIGFIILIIYIMSLILKNLINISIMQIFKTLPDSIYLFFYRVFNMIYNLFIIIIGIIITIHLFKIRYLDYYITIEDENIKTKTIEKNIEKEKTLKEEKNINNKKQEKIIIRDPKHTTYSFFNILAKIIQIILKIFIIFMVIPLIFSFILLSLCSTISIIWLKYGLIFLGIFICTIGSLCINYDLLELMYEFIFDRTYHFKRIFIIFITGLLIVGIGLGITLNEISKFDILNEKSSNNITLTLDMQDDILFDGLIDYYKNNNKIIIDNNIDNILINVSYGDNSKPIIEKTSDNIYYIHLEYTYNDFNIIKNILEDIKNKQIKSYNYYYEIESITLSQKNYDKIKNNIDEYYKNNNICEYCE